MTMSLTELMASQEVIHNAYLLKFLNFSEKQVILVTLDYAGLSTNIEDLKEFLRNHENVKTIVVDRFPIKAKMEVFEREALLLDGDTINKFDCRRRPVQRSL
ncbi:hypothetical protein EDC94DRAFT_648136 [Helicostylum pulchrum]|nr:hypothetical protein EDC94DRAFT_648136 [Helicostylum pulchrum]